MQPSLHSALSIYLSLSLSIYLYLFNYFQFSSYAQLNIISQTCDADERRDRT